MARRNVLQRLSWCSREQLEAIAKHVGFDVAAFPVDADTDTRVGTLYDWATSIRGPGLLSLEAAIPWSIEPEMSRQFEVQRMEWADDPRSTAPSYVATAASAKRPITITSASTIPDAPAAPPSAPTENISGGESRKPTIWEGSTFSEPYNPSRPAESRPAPAESTLSTTPAVSDVPHAGNESRRDPTTAFKTSPDDTAPRIARPETPHEVPAYGERVGAEVKAQAEAQRSNDPDPAEAPKESSSNGWWRSLLGKGGK